MNPTSRAGRPKPWALHRLREIDLSYWTLRAALLVVVFFLVLLGWWLGESREGYRLGEPSPRTYLAVLSTRYIDEENTERLRQIAEQKIVSVMTRDTHAERRIRDSLEQLSRWDATEGLSDSLRDLLSTLPAEKRIRMLHLAKDLGLSLLEVRDWDKDLQPKLWDRIIRLPLSRPDQNTIFQILVEIFQEPVQVDEEATEKLKRETAGKIEPVVRMIYPGDVIVSRGEMVTPQKFRLLEAQGYPKGDLPYRSLVFILFSVFVWSLWPTVYANRREIQVSRRDFVFIICLLSAGWTIQVMSAIFKADTLAFLPLTGWLYLTVPTSLAFHVSLGGAVIGALLSYSGSMAQLILWALSGIAASITGYLVFRGSNTRLDLWKQQVLTGISAAVVATAVRWWLGLPLESHVQGVYLLSVLGWATFTVALLPMLDTMFDILSPLRLMDLSHPSNPLLKRLQMEAPGTYHHTLMVGTLCEAAADVLGLDSLLVKAGAYFHDIGKLKRPQFFAENQMPGENLHDELKPSMSALVILSHVKDGLDLARRYNLPTRIRHFIAEHHGTTCLNYFYRKSKARGEDLPREQFSYPGPKPSSKETALVMLADSVEAAVRAAGGSIRGLPELRETVEGVLDSKMLDGQLELVDFTLKDLTLIKESFIQTLRSIYHKRDNTGTRSLFEPEQGGSEQGEISGSD
ncbi:MAG TPA: HDIG domain-containing protein [Synergistales bacterium]|nr:HDIG domain-containing protein [Synergistales bacterium]